MTLAAGTRLGPYEVLGPLGAGGMGEVYKGKDTRLDRTVAIKVLPSQLSTDPDLRARFEREARVVSALGHPNICTLHDVGHQDGIDYLVMEYLEGETLSDRLAKGALPLDQALRFGVQIADALDRAHRAGIVHRDVKPGNVMLTRTGAKLLDFGLAKSGGVGGTPALSALATQAPPLTEKGTLLGTVLYMAPEQLEGREADARSDLFAFGSVLFEMVTGKKAFSGSSQASVISAILRDAPLPVSQLAPMSPPALDRVVMSCLAKDPDERWQSAHDLAKELRWIADGRSSPSAVSGVAATPRRSALGLRATMLGVALVALALGAVFGRSFLVTPSIAPPPTRFSVLPAVPGAIEDQPVLSPDGRSVVYALAPPVGTTSLWIHSFESGEAKRLAGTEGAQDPFFSPDGRSLAFFGRGHLHRVDLATGTSQVICAAADARGGSWFLNGQIVFTPNSASPLFRVPASGGDPKAITQLTKGEQSHRFPFCLPDGRHVVYTSHGGEAERGIIWADMAGAARRHLVSDRSRAVYDSRGVLLFVRQGTLVAQRFDITRGELSGDPAAIADHVGTDDQKIAKAWFSAAGGTVAWRLGSAIERRLVWFERGGKEIGPVTSPGDYLEPVLSPGEDRVLVTRLDESGTSNIWSYDTRTKDRGTRLTSGIERAESAGWTPDGNGLVYSVVRGGRTLILRKPAAGSGAEETLFSSENRIWLDGCSSDGRFIVLEGTGPNGYGLSLLPLAGDRKPIPFTTSRANESHASFSPDGRALAYASDESGQLQVYVQDVPPTGRKWQVSTDGGDLPIWKGDGTELYYVNAARMLTAVPVESRAPFVIGEPRPLFAVKIPALAVTGNHAFYAPSRDGKRFLVLSSTTGKESEPGIRVILGWRPK